MHRTNIRLFPVAILLAAAPLLVSTASAQMDMQQTVSSQAMRNPSRSSTALPTAGQGISMVPAHFAQLKLAPGFLVSLQVLDDDDYNGTFRVDDDGNISLPDLGMVHVAGETATGARQKIAKLLLSKGLLNDPQVELNVVQYTAPHVTVIGEVTAPGSYPLLVPENLQDVLALAGGPTVLAGDQIQITPEAAPKTPIRVAYSRQMGVKKLENVMVHPGDTVQVARAGVIYVLGAVNRPGGYVMQQDGSLSLLQAVAIAGGTNVAASIGSIYIIRKNTDGAVVWFKVPYKKMTQGKSSDIQLSVNDVLFVPTSKFKATFTNTQSVLASAASAGIYSAIIY